MLAKNSGVLLITSIRSALCAEKLYLNLYIYWAKHALSRSIGLFTMDTVDFVRPWYSSDNLFAYVDLARVLLPEK